LAGNGCRKRKGRLFVPSFTPLVNFLKILLLPSQNK
jgi:hypothetical protein